MINIKRHNLTSFVEENILNHLTKEYRINYDHFDIYNKNKEDMEYLVGFKNDKNKMVITIYYRSNDTSIDLTSVAIGSTIPGEQVQSYTFTKNYKQDLFKMINKLERIMFNENTI